jgi:hypothetical protein
VKILPLLLAMVSGSQAWHVDTAGYIRKGQFLRHGL